MSAENHKKDIVMHNIEHYRQRFNWDCGVSCVLMLLPPQQRQEMLNNFHQICEEEGFGQSTWTIDLCYLLKRFGIKHCMYTMLLGVNDDYRRHRYYDKIITLDKERVLRRFREAPAADITALERSLSDQQLLEHVQTHGPVIVLVDAGLLVCDLCKHNKLKSEFRRCFGGSYRGHYIVCVGAAAGRLLYRDPALSPRLCRAPPARLRAARAAPGTDCDLILVFNDYASHHAPPEPTATT